MRPRTGAGVVGMAALLLTACGDAGPMASPQSEIDGEWELVEGTGPDGPLTLVDGYQVTLDIDGEQAGGRSACNHYGATVSRDDDGIRFGELSGTDMGCEPAVMDLEAAYLAAIASVEHATRDGDALVLTGPSAELRFDPVPPVPTADIVGTTWVLETLVKGETASSVMGEPATLLLEPDGTLTGSTGCRDLTGRFVEAGGEIAVPELSAGDGECPDDLWDQDDHVVAVIGDGFRASVDGDTLTLSSQGELGLVYRARSG